MALAGVGLESSFARFETSMIAFSTEMVLSGRAGRWDFGSMVVGREQCGGQAVRMGLNPNMDERASWKQSHLMRGD